MNCAFIASLINKFQCEWQFNASKFLFIYQFYTSKLLISAVRRFFNPKPYFTY